MPLRDEERRSLAEVVQPLERGECLVAFDRAMDRLDRAPGSVPAKYLAVLALARAGATERAVELLETFGLGDEVGSSHLAQDIAALRARLAKNRALDADAIERRELAAVAAQLYEEAEAAGGGAYCTVNAATMWLLAGEKARSEALASQTLSSLDRTPPVSAEDRYWRAATMAEAWLLLGRPSEAANALDEAAGEPGGVLSNRAVTRRQLSLVCALRDLDPQLLTAVSVPDVVHYCGHLLGGEPDDGELSPADRASLTRSIAAYLDDRQVGYAYGSLASGADILIAEALLARKVQLTVVLPFSREEFVATSVAPAGPDWERRFERCLAKAHGVVYSTEDEYLNDSSLFEYCARIAMGQAVMMANVLGARVEQLAIWDGQGLEGVGTGSNVRVWRAAGRPSHVIPWPESPRRSRRTETDASGRQIRAILFCDFKGFSALKDAQIRTFLHTVMQQLGHTLDQFGEQVLHVNTWGDGLNVVLEDVAAGASCALALQRTMRGVDLAAAGLPPDLGLRIGAHVGPVFRVDDPVRRVIGFYGTQVTRAARIEPGTPEGEVYASAPFAALAALDESRRFRCEYVGNVPLAKGYGRYPMYVVKRTSASPTS